MRLLSSIATVLGLVLAFNGSLAWAQDGDRIAVSDDFFDAASGAVEPAWPGYSVAEVRGRMMNNPKAEAAARAEVCSLAVYACEKSTGFKCEAVRMTDTVGMSGHYWAPADFKCWAGVAAVQPDEGTLLRAH